MSADRRTEASNMSNIGSSTLETLVVPRTTDLGDGFSVRRALPSAQKRLVGPFVFLDEMGPTLFRAGRGLDVRPHPHIGLATVTYLFDGEVLHRDSLGTVATIRPGELNWMTAGRGIAHSERTPPELRPSGSQLFGLQAWVALPKRHEETDPGFVHHGSDELPVIEGEGTWMRLIVGALHGSRSPVHTLWESVYAEVRLPVGAAFEIPVDHHERAAYLVGGTADLEGDGTYDAGRLLVFRPGTPIILKAVSSTVRFMLLGGEPMDGPRHIWWNFVSSSQERIEEAKADWQNGKFAPVPGENEFIPLPESRPAPVQYP